MALIGSRHAFVPHHAAPYRCAKCLRMLDCAPHLPIAPPASSWPPSLVLHIDKTIETLRPALDYIAERRRVREALQAAR